MFLIMILRVGYILELAGRESLSWYDTCFQLKRRYSENMTASVQRPSQVVSCSGRPVIVCKGTFSTHFQRKQKPKILSYPKVVEVPPSVCCPQSICPAAINFFSICNMGTLTSQYVANHNNDYHGAGRDWVWKNYLTRNNKRFKAEEAERAVTGWTADIRREGVPGPCQETQTSGRHKTKGHMECTMKAEFTLNDIMSTAKENT